MKQIVQENLHPKQKFPLSKSPKQLGKHSFSTLYTGFSFHCGGQDQLHSQEYELQGIIATG
jgi:hypothetical protein